MICIPWLRVAGVGDRGHMRDIAFTRNFSLLEMTVTTTGLPNVPTDAEVACLRALAINILQPLRDSLGKPITINSAFRAQAVNRRVGGAPTSQHRLGQAADIVVSGVSSRQVAKRIVALGLPFDQVIDEFGSWVHVSYGPRHRREILTAVKVRGVTTYKPGLV